MRKGIRVILILVFLMLTGVVSKAAPLSKKNKTPPGFSPALAQRMARQSAVVLAQVPLIAQAELPHKVAVGMFSLNVQPTQMTSRDFTNAILNAVLDEVPVLVVNDNSMPGEKIAYQLEKYEDDQTLRYHAAMLGAHYYLVGSIADTEWHPKPNKVKKGYIVDLQLKSIRNDQSEVTLKIPFTAGGKLISERKSHGRKPRSKT